MAYDEHGTPLTDKLCLYGEAAKDYMRIRVGETVKMTVTGLLTKAAIEPACDSEHEDTPTVEFEVLEVDGGKKPYAEMSNGEMESEIHNVKNEDQPEPPSTVPNREDGGSIWADVKRQDKVNRKAPGRVRPFGYR